jgi:L-lactate dehydrogenase complex protein LldG
MKSESQRDAFLRNVRHALSSERRPGRIGEPVARKVAGAGPAGPDLAAAFCKRLTEAGGVASRVVGDERAVHSIVQIIENIGATRILMGTAPVLGRLGASARLRELGREVTTADMLTAANARGAFFEAELAISGVDYLIAETGTVVVSARPREPRSLSLLPPVHIAVADEAQLLPDLFDLFESSLWKSADISSCVTLITGPSKTGDIELRLVTGVHGPREIYVVLIAPER